MNNENIKALTVDVAELNELLNKISMDYVCVDDEGLNEIFYSSLQKAKEFARNLDYIINRIKG